MVIELYDTFRILEEKDNFWDSMNGTPKKWDPYAGIGILEAKNRLFFYTLAL